MPEYHYSFRDKKRLSQINGELARIKKCKEKGGDQFLLKMREQRLLEEKEYITEKAGE